MIQPWIADIQKYSIHDGPGIRTTVFFKGCPLSCKWCHNPETQNYNQEFWWNPDKCTLCGNCVQQCPNHAIVIEEERVITQNTSCNGCHTCVEYCYPEARELCGYQLTPRELIAELEKDRTFYEESGGGITLSGGEVMTVDIDYLLQVLEPLHTKGYHIGIDTCGYGNYEKFEALLPYVDFFLYDLKIMDAKKHLQYTGVDNQLILDNLTKLGTQDTRIYLRIPVIHQINDNLENMRDTVAFLQKHQIRIWQVNLLPYHEMGSQKYRRLGLEYQKDWLSTPGRGTLEALAAIFSQEGYQVTID